jgi:hypothetical protein
MLSQNVHLFSAEELSRCRTNAQLMISHLDQARVVSSDPLEVPMAAFAFTIRTGKRGRPRIQMDPNTLAIALELSSKTRISKIAKCSTRTLRRRQLDYEINTREPSQPHIGLQHEPPHPDVTAEGELVMPDEIREEADPPDEATKEELYPANHLTDEELDLKVAGIIKDFPGFGCRFTTSSLLTRMGLRVPESRVRFTPLSQRRSRGVQWAECPPTSLQGCRGKFSLAP